MRRATSRGRLHEVRFAFTGWIVKVTADVSSQMIQDTEEAARAFAMAAMARQ